jgi:hypothetical protein
MYVMYGMYVCMCMYVLGMCLTTSKGLTKLLQRLKVGAVANIGYI